MLMKEVQDFHKLVRYELLDDVVPAIRLQQVLVITQHSSECGGVILGDLHIMRIRGCDKEGQFFCLNIHICGEEIGMHAGEMTVQIVDQLQ